MSHDPDPKSSVPSSEKGQVPIIVRKVQPGAAHGMTIKKKNMSSVSMSLCAGIIPTFFSFKIYMVEVKEAEVAQCSSL